MYKALGYSLQEQELLQAVKNTDGFDHYDTVLEREYQICCEKIFDIYNVKCYI